jgi:prepilin-type N-terminal cleavage/methylation domain-containing protein
MKVYNEGFSLIELSIVIVIMSFMLVGSIDITVGLLNSARQSDTIQRLRVIDKAIEAYIITNRKLPCPAGIKLVPSDANYGKENCVANETSGIKELNGILIGTIPVEELNLASKYIADGWDVKLQYQVVKDYAINGDNSLFSKNVADASCINTKFAYTIISHGKNKIGAIYYDSSAESSMGIDRATNGEKLNIFSLSNGKNIQEYRDTRAFDDIVIARNKETLVRELDLVDEGCVIGSDITTTISSKCTSVFTFTGTNSVTSGDYLSYKTRKYSNSIEESVGGGPTLKKQCVVECGAYGVINVYLLAKE